MEKDKAMLDEAGPRKVNSVEGANVGMSAQWPAAHRAPGGEGAAGGEAGSASCSQSGGTTPLAHSPQPSQAAAYSPSPDYESCRSLINRYADAHPLRFCIVNQC